METQFCIFYDSPLGKIAIRGDEKYIHSIEFEQLDKSDTTIVSNQNSNPSDMEENNAVLKGYNQLGEYFKGNRKTFDLSFHFEGTTFQKDVWTHLLDIPFGKTTSYLELSKKMNNVKAIRAVGSANGKNRHAIVVPCHRVIGSNGNLVGYAGELWRKKWLLEFERGTKQLELF